METIYQERCKKIHYIKKTPNLQNTSKQNLSTPFRPLADTVDNEPHIIDPQYQRDLYRDDNLYDQYKLEFLHNFNKSLEQIEDLDLITDSLVSDKLRYALIELWALVLNCLTIHLCQYSDHDLFPEKVTIRSLTQKSSHNSNQFQAKTRISYHYRQLRNKRRMFYVSMDYGELTNDGLIEAGALTRAISKEDPRNIRLQPRKKF